MRHDYISTEHLLLSITREKDGIAATVLQRHELSLEKARAQVRECCGLEPLVQQSIFEQIKNRLSKN